MLPRTPSSSVGPGFELQTTELLQSRPTGTTIPWPRVQDPSTGRFRHGYIGLSDRRMVPLLRPGSTVLIDTSLRRIEDAHWSSEYDRRCSSWKSAMVIVVAGFKRTNRA